MTELCLRGAFPITMDRACAASMKEPSEQPGAGHLSAALRKIDAIKNGLHMALRPPKGVIGVAQCRIYLVLIIEQAGAPGQEVTLLRLGSLKLTGGFSGTLGHPGDLHTLALSDGPVQGLRLPQVNDGLVHLPWQVRRDTSWRGAGTCSDVSGLFHAVREHRRHQVAHPVNPGSRGVLAGWMALLVVPGEIGREQKDRRLIGGHGHEVVWLRCQIKTAQVLIRAPDRDQGR